MIFFGSVFQSQFRLLLVNGQSFSLRALLRVIMDSLYRRYKLTLSLAICLCLMTPAHASHTDLGQETNLPEISTPFINSKTSINAPSDDQTQPIETVDNINGLAPTSIWQPEMQEPSLYALLDAEFAADRDDKRRALAIYKQQSFKDDATAVFERALSLSLRSERVEDSLQFAKAWQDQNPDHVPAWFYVAHLALRAHDYLLAGETLNRILRYDPRADLSEILIGIYPNNDEDKRELLAALQPLDSEQNASLSVLKAGLLYQFNEPEIAIVHINRALERQPDYVPFITLKADILRKIVTAETVVNYLNQARMRNPDSKSLYLYEIRYLLDIKQSQEAWELLLNAHSQFRDDEERVASKTLF